MLIELQGPGSWHFRASRNAALAFAPVAQFVERNPPIAQVFTAAQYKEFGQAVKYLSNEAKSRGNAQRRVAPARSLQQAPPQLVAREGQALGHERGFRPAHVERAHFLHLLDVFVHRPLGVAALDLEGLFQ